MEQPMFTRSKIAQNVMKHPCPACGDGTIEVLAPWKWEQAKPQQFYTGIRRCISDTCDCYSVPSMPEVRP